MLTDKRVTDFLDETASSSPAPGGGSVSALAGSLAAALTAMVCQLTIGKKKYADVEERMKSVLHRSESARREMEELIDADTEAFNGVMDAFGMPKETDEQKHARSTAIQEATKIATDVPLRLLRSCAGSLELVRAIVEHGNRNSLSDAGVAALLLSTAARGAAMNVYINLSGLKDDAFVSAVRTETETLERKVTDESETLAGTVRRALAG